MTRRLLRLAFEGSAVRASRLLTFRRVSRLAGAPLRHQPVFIIGAPRTGSTILYQALTDAFEVLYIDNLACRWSGNLPFGIWLSQLIYGPRPHGNFASNHGDTSRYGGHAPSECGAFWYRWLSKERHFVDDDEITQDMIVGIRREITAAINRHDRPFVFKNMNAGQRLRLIRRVFPGAKFIFIKRDPRLVVQSILQARAARGVPAGAIWSIRPRGFEEILALPEDEMVVAQVAAIEAQIDLDLGLFPKENSIVVNFEEVSESTIEALGEFMGAQRRRGGSIPVFKKTPPFEPQPRLDSLLDRYFSASAGLTDSR